MSQVDLVFGGLFSSSSGMSCCWEGERATLYPFYCITVGVLLLFLLTHSCFICIWIFQIIPFIISDCHSGMNEIIRSLSKLFITDKVCLTQSGSYRVLHSLTFSHTGLIMIIKGSVVGKWLHSISTVLFVPPACNMPALTCCNSPSILKMNLIPYLSNIVN